MPDTAMSYRPGQTVPACGVYACDCAHQHSYCTDAGEHRFPPMPHGCQGSIWTLVAEARTHHQ